MAMMGLGFGVDCLYCRMASAALSSASPPISPMTMMPSVSGWSKNSLSPSSSVVPVYHQIHVSSRSSHRESLPGSISPPMPTTILCPSPSRVVAPTAS